MNFLQIIEEFVSKMMISNSYQNSYGEECAICLEVFNQESKVNKLKCGHIYHKKCIIEWLSKDYSCPNCRIKL
jgi:hypothetical protein